MSYASEELRGNQDTASALLTLSEEQVQFCTFTVGDYFLGVNVANVQEVVRNQNVTPIPMSSDGILGIINLRGQAITAMDIRHYLKLENNSEGKQPMSIVVKYDKDQASFPVDKIGDVIALNKRGAEPAPAHLNPDIKRFIKCVYEYEGNSLLVLDGKKITSGV